MERITHNDKPYLFYHTTCETDEDKDLYRKGIKVPDFTVGDLIFTEPLESHHIIVYEAIQEEDRVEKGKEVGMVTGSYYRPGTFNKYAQWWFESNRERDVWIDILWSNVKGLGSVLLTKMEDLLRSKYMNKISRNNLYVMSFTDAIGFYQKRNYTMIYLEDESREAFLETKGYRFRWLAKNMDDSKPPEEEEEYTLSFYDKVNDGSIVYHDYFFETHTEEEFSTFFKSLDSPIDMDFKIKDTVDEYDLCHIEDQIIYIGGEKVSPLVYRFDSENPN